MTSFHLLKVQQCYNGSSFLLRRLLSVLLKQASAADAKIFCRSCEHPFCLRSNLGVGPWELTLRLMTQIQNGFLGFSEYVCFTSKEPHSAVRKQMSRHSICVKTCCWKSFMLGLGSSRPGCWHLCNISWKFPMIFSQDSQKTELEAEIIRTPVVNFSKLLINIIAAFQS